MPNNPQFDQRHHPVVARHPRPLDPKRSRTRCGRGKICRWQRVGASDNWLGPRIFGDCSDLDEWGR